MLETSTAYAAIGSIRNFRRDRILKEFIRLMI